MYVSVHYKFPFVKSTIRAMKLCGLDEAGRGALAGPLVASAIIGKLSRIKDGKLLKAEERQKIYRRLKKSGAEIYVEVISVRSINNHGIGWANRVIFKRLIKKIVADKFIIDGNLKIRGTESIVDADATIPEVILAGIIAKVERDKIMRELHKKFRRYHWKINKGYGTRKHLEALKKYGPCHYHRSVFVTTALALPTTTTTTAAGRTATKTTAAAKSTSTGPKTSTFP